MEEHLNPLRENQFTQGPAPDGSLPYKAAVSRAGIIFAVLMITSQLVCGIAAMLANLVWPDIVKQTWYIAVFGTVPMYVLAVPFALFLLRRFVPGTPARPPRQENPWWYCLLFLPVAILLLYVGNWVGIGITSLIGALRGGDVVNPMEQLFQLENGGLPLVTILIAVAVGPAIEEGVFRHALYPCFARFGDKVYILLSATMFAMYHGNLSQFFYAFLLGVLLAYAYCRTGDILVCYALHVFINFFGSVLSLMAMKNEVMMVLLAMLAMANLAGGIAILILRRGKAVYTLPRSALPPHPVRSAVCTLGGIIAILTSLALIVLSLFGT